MNVADEPNEIANFRIKDAEAWRWIRLRMRRIGKIADGFEADHGGDFVAARFASTSVNKASHFARQEIRRLLVHERDKAHRVLRFSGGKASRQSQRCSDTAAIVVRTRRTKY